MLYGQVSPATTESLKSRNSSSLLVVKRRWVEWEEVWQQEAFLARFFTFFTVIERKTLAQVHSTVGWSDLALLFQNPSTLQLCVLLGQYHAFLNQLSMPGRFTAYL